MLERDEYVEQAYFFRSLLERLEAAASVQDLLGAIREEVLATTNLPKAIDFLAAELKHAGALSPGMRRLGHYFTPFQAFVVGEAERDGGKFDFRTALELLRREAGFKAEGATPAALFVYQFEALARNRLGYDKGFEAMSRDPAYDEGWREWILTVRRQIGVVDLSDLIFVRSEYYRRTRPADAPTETPERPVLFGEKEGRIALAHRRKDPLMLFSALQRHLGYPSVPRPPRGDEQKDVLPLLLRRVERLEARLKLVEEEQRGGIDLSRFMGGAGQPGGGGRPASGEPGEE
jgi:hypothetical protein